MHTRAVSSAVFSIKDDVISASDDHTIKVQRIFVTGQVKLVFFLIPSDLGFAQHALSCGIHSFRLRYQ